MYICCLMVITHSSIPMLLIWLMKPNVFELCVPIGKVAMLGGYHDVVKLCARGVFLFHVGYGKLKTLGRKMCVRTYALFEGRSLPVSVPREDAHWCSGRSRDNRIGRKICQKSACSSANPCSQTNHCIIIACPGL